MPWSRPNENSKIDSDEKRHHQPADEREPLLGIADS